MNIHKDDVSNNFDTPSKDYYKQPIIKTLFFFILNLLSSIFFENVNILKIKFKLVQPSS